MNKKYRKLYDRIAPIYDLTTRTYAYFKSGSERNRRSEYLKELEIEDEDKVLEVSIGTGANLRYLPRRAQFFGVDISSGMLTQCRKKLRKFVLDVPLLLSAAEALPFRDQVFDAVYHVGSINFFDDKAAAIAEMIRVARPGTKIMIVDETEKIAKAYERSPGAAPFYKKRSATIVAPMSFVPSEMLDVHVKELCGGELYCLTFRKAETLS
jgi:ubiquinone/menaquinone biosynthesis C-methylase UbiE